MRPWRVLASVLMVVLLSAFPSPSGAASPALQKDGEITGNGQICNSRGECGNIQILFSPGGGAVRGSVNVIFPISDAGTGLKLGEEVLTGTLAGTYSGGDGGLVTGTMDSGTVTVTYTVSCPTCNNGTQSVIGTPWEGHFFADGTGTGWIGSADILWTVTYSAQDFQSGHSGPTRTPSSSTQVVAPTTGLSGGQVQATGQICDAQANCGPIQISFQPSGGPVSGTASGTFTFISSSDGINSTCTETESGILSGAFTGGDGGALSGTLSIAITDDTCTVNGVVIASEDRTTQGEWIGTLNANGTGRIWLPMALLEGGWFDLTFPAGSFQTGPGNGPGSIPAATPTENEYIQELIGGFSIEAGDKPWSEHELQLLREVITAMPPGLANRMALNSIVRYSSKLNRDGTVNTHVLGDYSPFDQTDCPTCARTAKTIRIYDQAATSFDFTNDSGDIQFKATVLHEMTHALQYNLEGSSWGVYTSSEVGAYVAATGTNNWTYSANGGWTWNADPNSPVSPPPTQYGHTNPLEDMSESVMLYVYDLQRLQTSSPERYNYIRDQIYGGVEYENGLPKGK